MLNRFSSRLRRALGVLCIALLGGAPAFAQLPTSVDIDLVPGPIATQLDVRLRANGNSFDQVFSGLTFTIRWVDTSPATLNAGTSPWCSGAAFPIAPSSMVTPGNGFKYRTYNSIATVALNDEDNGGCGASLPVGVWTTVHRINVSGNTGCVEFQIVNDTYTGSNNRNFFVSLNGQQGLAGTIEPTSVLNGNCAVDCNGVIGGTALPGTPCDDNNACTINDVYTGTAPNCGCAGTPDNTDSDGDGVPNCADNCPNTPGQIGSACNDGNACTDNDVLNASCNCVGTPNNTDSDGDGVPNCADNCPNTPGQIGSACNDGNACTDNDVLNASCNCVGTPNNTDSDGDGVPNCADNCPNTPGQIGSACNDGNACTDNDVLNASCNCVGTPNNTDSDGDGVPNCADNCPNTPGQIGSACNDGNACTDNDVLNASCNCVGTPNNTDSDGDGVPNCADNCPNTPGQIGSACNDGNACTDNDVLNSSCNCVGTPNNTDSDGDGVPNCADNCPNTPGQIGSACNDGNACTDNDVLNASCNCVGTPNNTDSDGDGVPNCADNCPNTPGQIGSACDDGNPCTIGDLINASCNCVGTPDNTDTDGDGVPNCADNCPNTPGQIGSACDDGNPCTIGDLINASCNCVGTPDNTDTDGDGVPNCADNCPNTPGQIGSSCNDGNPCTIGDLINASCNCVGTFQDTDSDGVCDANDPCPTQANVVPGQSCNDGDACTINDTVDANCNCVGTLQDTDSDGVCDANDPCPLLPFLVNGDPCDDGNPNTSGDVVVNCVCAGTLPNDCEGVPGGPAQPGTACNDNDPCTINDLYDANCGCAGTFQDTDNDGVCDASDDCPTVPGQIGSSCNDGNPCTINDALDANCNCAGTFQDTDSDGVCDANDPCPTQANVVPGQSCNDGDACTINDTVDANCNCVGTVQDTDSDGVCDANDPCPLLPFLVNGDPCDDGNPNTSGDVVVNCVCAGTLPNDCEGVPGGPAQPGTACNDNDPCTINDLYDANCGCAGTFQDTDNDGVCDASDDCPTVPGQIGSSCNDGNPCTINDALDANCNCAGTFQDTDSDGVCDANDPCPTQANVVPGQSCNDGDACTINDTVDANCNCVGTVQDTDSDGVCDANDPCPLLPFLLNGDPCDDGNPNTSGDVVVNCVCAGTLANDCEGVPGGPAQPGTACNDNDPCTINDLYDANCGCAGTFQDTDNDGVCDASDDCPTVPGQIGSSCDDGNVGTIDDMINEDCECEGTPVTGCEYPTNLVISTDANGAETSWEILLQGTSNVVCSGGPYTGINNSVISEACCLTNACYVLRFYDGGGDGITGGGYLLVRQSGTRLIDNRQNGGFLGLSAIANGEGFCLPNGTDHLIATSCDKEWWTGVNQYVVANDRAAVSAVYTDYPVGSPEHANTGYQMWWFNPNGGYTFRRFQSHSTANGLAASATRACHFKINNWAGNQLQAGVLYNVRVRSRVLGVYEEFGPACRFRIDQTLALCPPTQLVNSQGPEYSCGVVRQFPSTQKLWAWGRPGANRYQFEFAIPSEGILFTRTSTTNWIALNWSGANVLLDGRTYNVRVRISKTAGATWCTWGETCLVTISNGQGEMVLEGGSDGADALPGESRMTVWPNPNRGEALSFRIDGFSATDEAVSIELFDLLGNRVISTTRAAQDGSVNGSLDLPADLGTGMYVMHVTSGGRSWTERVVMQR